MADGVNEGDRFSLKRWSQRKRDAARIPLADSPAHAPAPAPSDVIASKPALASDLDHSTLVAPATHPNRSTPLAPAVETSLPPVDSLTFDSDFRGFLQPKVDEVVKRAALKKLFNDPRFNVMDRLDVYIDDYSLPDPLPREWLRELASAQNILNPPQTRVNDQGFAEDVPPENADAEAASAEPKEHPMSTEPVIATPTPASTEVTRMPVAATAVAVDPAAGADDPDRLPMPRKPA
ncbi:MAG: DUF3306 domain-containing protein [Betaproteobacteria bacterium]|nr:DUF3306 domain-containing protein [Betaproteobacteria bacterium]